MKELAKLIFSASVAFTACVSAYAAGDADGEAAAPAFLEQVTPRDSILVADHLRYGFRLDGVSDGSAIFLPEVKDTLSKELPVTEGWKIDTLKTYKRRHVKDIRAYLTIVPFEEGQYVLPDIPAVIVSPDGKADSLVFKGLEAKVCAPQIDMENYDQPPIKAQMKYPVTFLEVLPWLAGGLLLCALAVLSVWYVRRRRAKREEELHKDPPHIVALRKLDSFRGDKWWAPVKQKQFYSGVTDALREYISSRYGVGAMEMTTPEIFNELKKSDMPDDLQNELRELFSLSDFVKFAKFTASDEENSKVLPLGIRFITSTYQEEIKEENDVL